MSRTDEQVRMVVVDDDERKVAFEVSVRRTHGLDQIAVVMALDKMDDDLRVRLGAERVPVVLQRFLQLAVVLDDPVEHDREPSVVATRQRMRVLLVDGAVCCPACVSETVLRTRAVVSGCVLQELQVADGAHVVECTVFAEREPGGVVATVLEALEPSEEQRLRLTRSDVSDDPAHPKLLSVAGLNAGRIKLAADSRFLPVSWLPKRESPTESPAPHRSSAAASPSPVT